MTLPDGAVQLFSEVTRFSALDSQGFVAAGALTYTTNQLIKATFAPNVETGVDLVQINANGDITAHFKHGDMPKYYEMTIQTSSSDPILKQMLTGGVVFTDSSSALGLTTGTAATGQVTLGTLLPGTYGYRTSQFNQYGESVAAGEVTGTVASGAAGAVVVHGVVMASGALGWNVYGRQPGGEQLLGSVANIGTQATSASSGTGTVVTLGVTALTSPIPAGFSFQITGDTNTVKIVFTTTEAAGIGAVSLNVVASQSVTTTIVAANIVPVFVDNGTIAPNGQPPTVDTTGGPGNDVGYQFPALGIVGNPQGVGIEFFTRMNLNGTFATGLSYNRWVIPGVRNLRDDSREFSPTLMLPTYLGQAFENPNWGSGPFGDWQFDSSKVAQYARCGADIVPDSGLSPVEATF